MQMSVFLCTLLLLPAVGTAAPQTISATPSEVRIVSIRVSGNTAFTVREILDGISSTPSSPFSESRLHADLERVRERYRNAGYLGVSVTAEHHPVNDDTTLREITLDIMEGKRTLFGGVRFSRSDGEEPPDELPDPESRIGDPLESRFLQNDIRTLLLAEERKGHPLASCVIDSLTIVQGDEIDSALVHLTLRRGPFVTIEEVQIEGNTETSDDVILRESRVRRGEQFHPDRVAAIRRRLVRLNIFSSVSEPELYMRGSRGGLLLRVQEGNTNTFDGIAGYMPASVPGESGYLTGQVAVAMRNLFGTARKLHFRWQKEDRLSQELHVAYAEPWLFGLPVSAALEFQQRRQDSTYVRQGILVRADVLISDELSLSGIIGSESVIPSVQAGTSTVARSATMTLGGEVVYDTRDDLYAPRRGVRYRADYNYARKSISAPDAPPGGVEHLQRFGLDLESYLEPFSRQVLLVGLHGRQVQGGGIDASELFRFGGARTLRGYRENQFLGSRVGWAAVEYRFLLARHSFLYGFFDTGYYFRPAEPLRLVTGSEAFLYGYGIGLRFDTSLGNLGVSFALGKGDSFAQGKIHVGIVNEF